MNVTNPQFVLAVTGGGTEVIGNYLARGGASSWFLEGLVPYHPNSLSKFLGFQPKQYCSAEVARQMAMSAFKRAIELGSEPGQAVGVACTASLVKPSGEREGREHKAFIAYQTLDSTGVDSFKLISNRTRLEEERFVSSLIQFQVDAIKQAHSIHEINKKRLLTNDEYNAYKSERADDNFGIKTLLTTDKKRDYKLIPLSVPDRFLSVRSVIYAGSYNPLHDGHVDVVLRAAQKIGKPIYLEISLTNVDKPPIDYLDVAYRVNGILSHSNQEFQNALAGIIISTTPKFYDKVWQYPSSTYLMGADTMNRLFDPKYGDIGSLMDLVRDTNSRFLVSMRPGYESNVFRISQYGMENRFEFLDGESLDISSSDIRKEIVNA